ncbi:MAG: hypothetical protein NT128_05660, partial [Proteobacteria bacterium]|nr:hypothetical protein [Pseudomonadota bacterium]
MKCFYKIFVAVVAISLAAFYFLNHKPEVTVVYAVCDQSKLGEVNMVMSVAETVPHICKNYAFLTYVADFKLLSKDLKKKKKN